LLITVGIFVATQLLNSVSALWLTEYGQILSAKLIVVTTILLLALYHKLRLVPGLLLQSEYPDRLARSIQIEMVLGFIILLTTAVLTTLVGPSHVA
jgi:putative copper resistance protein D